MGYKINLNEGILKATIINTGENVELDFSYTNIEIIKLYRHLPANPCTNEYNEVLLFHSDETKYLYINPNAFDIKTTCDLNEIDATIFEIDVDHEQLFIGDFINNISYFTWNIFDEFGWGFFELKSDGIHTLIKHEFSDNHEMELNSYFYSEDDHLYCQPYVNLYQLDAYRIFHMIDFENERSMKINYNYKSYTREYLKNDTKLRYSYYFNNLFPTSSEVKFLIPDAATVRGSNIGIYEDYYSLSYDLIGNFNYKTGIAQVNRKGKISFINKYFFHVTDWFDEILTEDQLKHHYKIEIELLTKKENCFWVRKEKIIMQIYVCGDLLKIYSSKPYLFYKYGDKFQESWEGIYKSKKFNMPLDLDGLIIPQLDMEIVNYYWEYDTMEDVDEIIRLTYKEKYDGPEKNVLERIIDFQYLLRNAQELSQDELIDALEIHKRDNGIIPCGFRILNSWDIK